MTLGRPSRFLAIAATLALIAAACGDELKESLTAALDTTIADAEDVQEVNELKDVEGSDGSDGTDGADSTDGETGSTSINPTPDTSDTESPETDTTSADSEGSKDVKAGQIDTEKPTKDSQSTPDANDAEAIKDTAAADNDVKTDVGAATKDTTQAMDSGKADTSAPAKDTGAPIPKFTVCCSPFGTCSTVGAKYCKDNGGQWLEAKLCDPNPCPPAGACCDPTVKICVQLAQKPCEQSGMTWIGSNTKCSPNPCIVQPGACCLKSGACTIQHPSECTALSGDFKGNGLLCTKELCPIPVKPKGCCLPMGSCKMLVEAECKANGGEPFKGSCTDPEIPCVGEGKGACCSSNTNCKTTTFEECDDGIYLGQGTVCSEKTCVGVTESKWACCYDNGCKMTTETPCLNSGGSYLMYAMCAQNPCGSGGPGACCTKNGCFQADQKKCISEPYLYAGEGVPCSAKACKDFVTGACCDKNIKQCLPNTPKAICEGNAQHKFMGAGSGCKPNPCEKAANVKCQKFDDPACNDGEPCTEDFCNMESKICVNEPVKGCAENSPCVPAFTPTSSNPNVNACVCKTKPSCCNSQWSAGCVKVAQESCNTNCDCATMDPEDSYCKKDSDCQFCNTKQCSDWLCFQDHCVPNTSTPGCEEPKPQN